MHQSRKAPQSIKSKQAKKDAGNKDTSKFLAWQFGGVLVGAVVSAATGSIVPMILTLVAGAAISIAIVRGRVDRVERDNNVDHDFAQALLASEPGFHASVNTAVTASESVRRYPMMKLGEVHRHFDTETTLSITGWMNHRFGVEGWGLGASLGRLGVGLGQVGLRGTSDVSLHGEAITRTNLMSDGFVAVVETRSERTVDTLRLVCPSESSCREAVRLLLATLGEHFGQGSHTQLATNEIASRLFVSTDVSYASDRLHAVSRMEPEERPAIEVAGTPLSDHAVLASAIRFKGEDRWLRLAPVGLFDAIAGAMISAGFPTLDQASVARGDRESP